MTEDRRRRRAPILGVLAYVLVPGNGAGARPGTFAGRGWRSCGASALSRAPRGGGRMPGRSAGSGSR
ncbi:hypothetical protein [Rubrobacter marinus]|uniref:hypothetical protein n=1 Tax=Rubrobacter marinus TaxID=2653852 RepID=UPI00140CB0B3|nr:hypothetical protein [Rubrobacter marinus]